MPTPRALFPLANQDGRLYALGGISTGPRAIAEVDVFDVRTGTWSEGPALPEPRNGSAAVALDGRVYVLSGTGTTTASHAALPTTFEYDAAAATARSTSPREVEGNAGTARRRR